MKPIIEIENLSKLYHVGKIRSNSLKQTAERWWYWISRTQPPSIKSFQIREFSDAERGPTPNSFWALKKVSFTVNPGEVIGIIGRNGAGKSTLLKILSRITEPTSGQAILRGRVASLLEVGTGFHPDLTGRENVYMNGSILGMRKREIDKKFDEIIAFAEVEQFVDTPVKHYSSGMYVRLAFAVAAHLDPEILFVDEVLAVGDAAFQKKCMGKMGEVAHQGRTIFFVSHNLQAIQRLCSTVCLLDRGQLIQKGSASEAVNAYLKRFASSGVLPASKKLSSDFLFQNIKIIQNAQDANDHLDNQLPFQIQINYEILNPMRNLLLGFDIHAADGTHVFRSYDLEAEAGKERQSGSYQSVCDFPGGLFQPETYYVNLIVGIHRLRWLTYEEMSVPLFFSGLKKSDATYPGVTQPLGAWSVKRVNH